MNAFTTLFSRTIAPSIRGLVAALAIAAVPVVLAQPQSQHQPTGRLQPANSILLHNVVLPGHGRVGDVTDLLVQMPAGRILFVAVKPVELFQQPRAIDPAKLRPAANGDLELTLSYDDWVRAPLVSWTGTTVEDYTRNGTRLVATYEPGWSALTRNATRSRSMPVMPSVAQFVSLRQLTSTPLVDVRRKDFGYVASFLVDWPGQRVSFAIASPELPPLPGLPVQRGVAVPLALLSPGRGDVLVSADSNRFNQAPLLSANATGEAANAPRVFRYDRNALLANLQPAGRR